MDSEPAPNTSVAQQRLADMDENLELRRWKASHPTWLALMSAVDEAARRAASLARLENAISRLA